MVHIIIGVVAGIILLLLLLLLCLLCFLCCARKRADKEKSNLQASSSIETSATSLPSNKSYSYEVDNDMLGSTELTVENLFMAGGAGAGGERKNVAEVSELTLDVETLRNNNTSLANGNGVMGPKIPVLPPSKPLSSAHSASINSLRDARTTLEPRPLPPVPPPLASPSRSNSCASPPPPPPPPYVKKSPSDCNKNSNPNNPSTAKTTPDNPKASLSLFSSPPKLHTQARGFAPASHARPAPVKSTWGRSRFNKNS